MLSLRFDHFGSPSELQLQKLPQNLCILRSQPSYGLPSLSTKTLWANGKRPGLERPSAS